MPLEMPVTDENWPDQVVDAEVVFARQGAEGVGAAQPPGAGGGKAGNHRFHLSKSLNTCCRGGMESALGQERG